MSSAQLAEALFAAYGRRDLRALESMYDRDSVHVEMCSGRMKEGSEAIASGLGYFLRCFPDAKWEVDKLIASGDSVAATYRLTAALQADLGNIRGQGQRICIEGVFLIHTESGVIRRSEDYWDMNTFIEQLTDASDTTRVS